jgi:hypothetical protein
MGNRSWVLCLLIFVFYGFPLVASDNVTEKTPQSDIPYSTAEAMMLDFIPGGGHFYTDHYMSGSIFAVAKIGAFFTSWLFYDYWQRASDNYRNAVKISASLGVSNDTLIPGPDGEMRSVSSYRSEYYRSAQFFTFSVVANVALWAASWLMVWNYCDEHNRNAVPAFDATFSFRDTGVGREEVISLSFTGHF